MYLDYMAHLAEPLLVIEITIQTSEGQLAKVHIDGFFCRHGEPSLLVSKWTIGRIGN